jgi:hypothetical protein
MEAASSAGRSGVVLIADVIKGSNAAMTDQFRVGDTITKVGFRIQVIREKLLLGEEGRRGE